MTDDLGVLHEIAKAQEADSRSREADANQRQKEKLDFRNRHEAFMRQTVGPALVKLSKDLDAQGVIESRFEVGPTEAFLFVSRRETSAKVVVWTGDFEKQMVVIRSGAPEGRQDQQSMLLAEDYLTRETVREKTVERVKLFLENAEI